MGNSKSGNCPWTTVYNVHGICPLFHEEMLEKIPWTMSTVPWTLSLDSMDIVHTFHGFHGHCPHIPWILWTMSMHSVENIHGFYGKCPGCPWNLWTFYRRELLIKHEFHHRLVISDAFCKIHNIFRCVGFYNTSLSQLLAYDCLSLFLYNSPYEPYL